MNHNIITDKDGNEHQAVNDPYIESEVYSCHYCTLLHMAECSDAPCIGSQTIYKRKIKIGDVKR